MSLAGRQGFILRRALLLQTGERAICPIEGVRDLECARLFNRLRTDCLTVSDAIGVSHPNALRGFREMLYGRCLPHRPTTSLQFVTR